MFSRLLESNPRRQRRLGGTIVSAGIHLVVIALAVRATGLTAAPSPKTPDVVVIYRPPAPPAPSVRPPISRQRSADPTAQAMPSLPVVPPVIDVPSTLPPPGTSLPSIVRPEDFRPAGGTASGRRDGSPNVAEGEPYTEPFVEKAVVAIPGTATPRYPSMLQSAGIEGDVRTQFVVDTLGRVEPGSVRVLESTRDLFASAVRDALARARFKPAEAGGHKVRQLVEQTFTFRIAR